MTISIINRSTGKEMQLTKQQAEFFGPMDGVKKIMCLPIKSDVDISGESVPHIYEISKAYKKKHVGGICVIRMGGIGDLTMLSSGLRALIDKEDKVTLATLPQHIAFMTYLGFDCISIEDLGRYEFDKIIDLRFAVEPKEMGSICKGTWESYTLDDRSDAFDKLLGVYPAMKWFDMPQNPPSAIAEHSIDKAIGDCGAPIVAINASIMASARSIRTKAVQPICIGIKKLGLVPVLFGVSQPWNQELKEINGAINLIDKTNWQEMVSLIKKASVVVTPDSGPLHIAAALGKKTVALFGNINPRTRISYYPTVKALYPQGELPCIPCWDMHHCVTKPEEGVKCMALLTPDRVVNAVREIGGFSG